MKKHSINVFGYDCQATIGRYGNGRIAIRYHTQDREPMAVLTVNLPNTDLKDDEFCIKDWSENEPIARAAMETGVFEDTGKQIPTGFVTAKVWKFRE